MTKRKLVKWILRFVSGAVLTAGILVALSTMGLVEQSGFDATQIPAIFVRLFVGAVLALGGLEAFDLV